jgi:hypothetical protein
MIANEMNRTSKLLGGNQGESRRLGYERVLRLTDLTIAQDVRPTLRRELLRWRDLSAQLYIADNAQPDEHRSAFRALLLLHPVTARQIPFLLGPGASDA